MKRREFMAAVALASPAAIVSATEDSPEWLQILRAETDGLRKDLGQHYGHHEYYAVSEKRLQAIFDAVQEI